MSFPASWRIQNLSDIATKLKAGGTPSATNTAYYGGDIPFVKIGDISDERKYLNETEDTLTDEGVKNSSTWIVPEGALLYTMYGSYGIPKITKIECATNQAIIALLPKKESIDINYLYYYLASIKEDLGKQTKGTTQQNLNAKIVRNIEIPLPPLDEQERIVAKIEELFSKLDSGVKDIQTANMRLEQYKRTILQNAVEGKLTKNWRLTQDDIEPADQLLKRTEELRENECGGKYGKLVGPDDIPDGIEIPQNWAWASLSQLGEVSRGKSTHRPRDDPSLFGGEYPFIQTGDVRAADTILNSYEQTYNEKGLEQSRLWPEGTLCITIAANIGETAILGIDACFPDSVVGFLTNPEYCNVRYAEIYFRTIQRDLERYAPATAQKNINLGTLSDLPIPLPPVKEQNRIVQQVHSVLSVLTNNMETISDELVRSDRLRQSILKQAFRSELVSQNHHSDSEEIGLERASSESKPEFPKQATLSEVASDVE